MTILPHEVCELHKVSNSYGPWGGLPCPWPSCKNGVTFSTVTIPIADEGFKADLVGDNTIADEDGVVQGATIPVGTFTRRCYVWRSGAHQFSRLYAWSLFPDSDPEGELMPEIKAYWMVSYRWKHDSHPGWLFSTCAWEGSLVDWWLSYNFENRESVLLLATPITETEHEKLGREL